MWCWLFCFLLLFNGLVAEKRSPLKPLELSPKILQGLLDLEPKVEGFVSTSFRDSLVTNAMPTKAEFFEDPAVLIAEESFNRFCQKGDFSIDFSIPPVIHLIWLGSKPPPAVAFALASWTKYHAGWEVKLWTDEEMENFLWSSPRSAHIFHQAKNCAEKSDILRFEILYQFGGIYSDTDVICLKSFEDLVTKDLTFFACIEDNRIRDLGRPLIGSAIIGAAKKSPVIKRCIDFSQTQAEAPNLLQHLRSGPGPLTMASYEALVSGAENLLILPCSYFYPLPFKKRAATIDAIIEHIKPETFAIHLWEGSWLGMF